MSSVLLLLLVLACPLMMWLMMRGGHGHGHGGGHAEHHDRPQGIEAMSVDELRDLRDDLDEVIASRERSGEDAHAALAQK